MSNCVRKNGVSVAEPDVRRVRVWSGVVRGTHWLLAASTLVLLATGGLIPVLPGDQAVRDYHYLAGYVLVLALGLRLIFLVSGTREAHIRALLPGRGFVRSLGGMLRFYGTLGRAPLPRWYAHNPVWAPVYLLLLVLLAVQVATGFARADAAWAALIPTSWHALGARLVLVLVVAHVVAAVLHDWRGTGSDLSAMINGHRTFEQPGRPVGLDVPDPARFPAGGPGAQADRR